MGFVSRGFQSETQARLSALKRGFGSFGGVSNETPLTESTNTSTQMMLRSILVLCIASIVSAAGYYLPAISFSDASSVSAGAVYTPETDSE